MNSKIKYLAALSQFTRAATEATCYANSCIAPGKQQDLLPIITHLKRLFGQVDPFIMNTDSVFEQKLRDLYGALLNQLVEHCSSYFHHNPIGKLSPSRDAHLTYHLRTDSQLQDIMTRAAWHTHEALRIA